MKNSLLITHIAMGLASRNGGVVRPSDVEGVLSRPLYKNFAASRYAVREMFREMKLDRLLELRGNYYVVNPEHWMFCINEAGFGEGVPF